MVWYFHKTYISYDIVNEIEVCLDPRTGDKGARIKSTGNDSSNSIMNDIINYDLNDFDDFNGGGAHGVSDNFSHRNGDTNFQNTASSNSKGNCNDNSNENGINNDVINAEIGINYGTGLKNWMSRAHLGYVYGGKSRTHVSHTGYWSEGMKNEKNKFKNEFSLGENPWGMTLWGVWETSSHGSHFELQKGGVFNATPVIN
jgi:hypothetical protein